MEAVAETSEEFMDRYFEGDEFSIEEIRAAMRTEVMDGDIVPVAMGSNVQAQGVANLLSDIVRFFPSPDKRSCAGIHRTKSEIYEADYDFSKAKSAYVFKTMVDPFIGKYSFVKVCSGVLKGDDVLLQCRCGCRGKTGQALYDVRKQTDRSFRTVCRRYRSNRKAWKYKDRRYSFDKEYADYIFQNRLFGSIYLYEIQDSDKRG